MSKSAAKVRNRSGSEKRIVGIPGFPPPMIPVRGVFVSDLDNCCLYRRVSCLSVRGSRPVESSRTTASVAVPIGGWPALWSATPRSRVRASPRASSGGSMLRPATVYGTGPSGEVHARTDLDAELNRSRRRGGPSDRSPGRRAAGRGSARSAIVHAVHV